MNILKKIALCFFLLFISISWAAEKNWIRLDIEKTIDSTAVALSGNGLKIALADKSPGFIYTSSDAGITWTEQKGSGQRNWSAIAFSGDASLLVAANQNGFIYTSSDAGITWTEQKGSGQRNWSAIASNENGTRLFAADNNGYIYTSSDKGITWIERTKSGQRTWRSIAVSSTGAKVAAAAQNGYIYTSTDYGVTWLESANGGKRSWYSLASSADGNKLVAADFGGYLYTSGNGGNTWSGRTAVDRRNWTSVASSADGNKLIAAVDNGRVYVSVNSGSTWIELELSMVRRWSFLTSSADGSMIVGTVVGGGAYALTTPLILNISSSISDGIYKIGEIIPIDVTFSEPVTSSGVTLTLETGKTDRTCVFSISNNKNGTCNYEVQGGDNASFLTINAIKGTIRDISGKILTNYTPLKNLSDNKKLNIDTSNSSQTTTNPTINFCGKNKMYRICPLTKPLENTLQYRENMICEGFINEEQSRSKRISRIEVLNIAVNMLHGPKSAATDYDDTYTDITTTGNSQETVAVVQTGLDNNLIFPNNGAFEPTKNISRIEAYALLMRGVCMKPDEGEDAVRAIHQKAFQNGITTKSWARFRANSAITRNEVFIVASQLADWADKNGGCDKLECRK